MRRAITLRIEVCGTRVSPGAMNTGCPKDAGATLGAPAARGAVAGAGPGLADSTSALTMRPFGPLPVIRERSSPFSAAIRLASGEAKMRPPAGAAAGFAAGAGATGAGAAGAGLRAAGGAAAAAGFGAGAGAGAAPAGTAVSPSSSRIAITALTATPSAPSGTTIWPILPSSTASTSMVALSVSISQITWPDLTVSPTFTCHLASLPSVMVGDRAGIRTGMDIRSGLDQDVGPQFRRIGLGTVLRIFRRVVHDLADLGVDRLQCGFIGLLLVEQDLAHMVDRIAFVAILVDFFLGPVLRRVAHRMAAIAISLHLEDVRALAAAGMFDGLLAGCPHRQHVHAVDALAGDAEGFAMAIELGGGRGALDRGPHAVAVVLDDIDDGELPEGGHVHGLVDLALVGAAVTKIGQRDVLVAVVLVHEGEARADRHLGADDAVAAVEILLAAEHVHRAALALGIAGAATGQLGHHALGVHAGGQHVAVIAVGGDDGVLGVDGRLHADDDGFLADVEMAEPADQAHAVELAGALLEAADQQHVAVV